LIASTVVALGATTADMATCQAYAAALVLVIGLIFLVAGLARLGWVTQFLSKPVRFHDLHFHRYLGFANSICGLLGCIAEFRDVHLPLSGEGRYEERPAPKQLPSNRVTLLSPVGSLFFAGATEFEEKLPAVENAERAVVLLRLRGKEEIGSTFLRVIARYAESLKANQGKLALIGVSEPVYTQLQKTSLLDQLGPENVYKASAIMGDSALNAYQEAVAWLGLDDVESYTQNHNDV
jgi:MFS superfamily sulfate permease-like transporter